MKRMKYSTVDEPWWFTPSNERLENSIDDNINKENDELEFTGPTSGMKEKMENICEKISSSIIEKVSSFNYKYYNIFR